MTYKSNETYGTSLGGLCTFLAKIISLIFILGLTLSFFFGGREFEMQIKPDYLEITEKKNYEVKGYDFIPFV